MPLSDDNSRPLFRSRPPFGVSDDIENYPDSPSKQKYIDNRQAYLAPIKGLVAPRYPIMSPLQKHVSVTSSDFKWRKVKEDKNKLMQQQSCILLSHGFSSAESFRYLPDIIRSKGSQKFLRSSSARGPSHNTKNILPH